MKPRTTRFTMLIHLPRQDGYGLIPRPERAAAGRLRRGHDENALAAGRHLGCRSGHLRWHELAPPRWTR